VVVADGLKIKARFVARDGVEHFGADAVALSRPLFKPLEQALVAKLRSEAH